MSLYSHTDPLLRLLRELHDDRTRQLRRLRGALERHFFIVEHTLARIEENTRPAPPPPPREVGSQELHVSKPTLERI